MSARDDLREWVAFLRDSGVPELREVAAAPRAQAPPPARAAAPEPAPPPPASGSRASGLWDEAERLDTRSDGSDPAARLARIRETIGECTRCKLHEGRANIVFGVGDPRAGLMFVGEGPGADEDARGEPFVGRAGQKLDQMIASIGLRREEVYIANVVKCRPPGNRDPERDEIATCSPFLVQQIEAVRPRVIVTLGSPATKTLLGTSEGITRLRGKWHAYRGIPVMPTFHPAYLLRAYTVENRRRVWEDLLAAKSRMEGTA